MKLPEGPKDSPRSLSRHFKTDPLGFMDAMGDRYGDIFTILGGDTPLVIVSNPQGMKQIFTSAKEIAASGKLNQGGAPLVGNNGLLMLDGLRHKHRRQLLMPPLHGNRVKTYGQRICEVADKVMNDLAIGESFYAYPTVQKITLEVILQALFGLHEGERYEQFRLLFSKLLSFARSRWLGLSLSYPFLRRDLGRWSPWGYWQNLQRQFDKLLYTEIAERREQADASRTDVLSELIFARDETGQPMTYEDMRDLFPSLLLGGQDASATAITWSLYWIHSLPAVRDRLLEELDPLGESPDPMSIVALPYLSAVCNEALRIYPTQVVTFPRLVESPIEVMGYELSPGTVVRGSIYLTHQREDLYPQPKQFKPERFLERQYSPYEFLPFGGGARRCPGEALALFEMKLVLATILSRYQLVLADEKRVEKPKAIGVNYPPASGLKMLMLDRRSGQEQPQQFVANSA
ncbi:cytochrome P450 [Nostoc sp. 'Peltigera membranacea cyanobiont' 213]|uniref:cytochrome P450 n=1 Tax=Nostoc sp. 'Peltigera membranacea cyanobiont' 213 TaxID=2014530 RepID=UPI000B959836|nr:cytochrome P450 [Nostoc sp. 'Peltigera membranacea cyanobiont' 213]OYD96050.1 cytochrome P450 [Nostoc sp. 'Peltigera membranacea cyanobiont' 213]